MSPTPPDPRSLVDPMAQLESEIAQAEARGEPLPEQAYLMLERLRELMAAVEGLSDTLGPLRDAGLIIGEDPAAKPPTQPEQSGEGSGGRKP